MVFGRIRSFFRPQTNDRDNFQASGPQHLTPIDWKDEDHRRSVAACLVKGVYVMQLDRSHSHLENEALAPQWWKSFGFKLFTELTDESCIFGAIFELEPSYHNSTINEKTPPRCVIAFRGTQLKPDTFLNDVISDIHIVLNTLHTTTLYEKAQQAVLSMAEKHGSSNIWLAGHSLGSALGMLVGKKLAKSNQLLESFLFNPPFPAAPLGRIKYPIITHGVRFLSNVFTVILVHATHNDKQNESNGTSVNSSEWIPSLYVNERDHICSEYIGYFEHKKNMEDMGFGMIEKLATQYSVRNLIKNAIHEDAIIEEPMHLLPSANLVVNMSPVNNFREAHGILQWCRSDIDTDFKSYKRWKHNESIASRVWDIYVRFYRSSPGDFED